MKIACACIAMFFALSASAEEIPNRLIRYDAFQSQVAAVGKIREDRRISEEKFMEMAADPAVVVLDARGAEKYAQLHVKGARNLSLPDITADELAKIIPDKSIAILIYCNNNFLNAPNAFPEKALSASLNVYTFTVLHSYGYANVYELGPLIDIRKAKLAFEGSQMPLREASY